MKKKMTGFLTLRAITVPFFYDTAMGEPEEDAEGHDVEDDLGQVLRKAKKFAKQKRNREI